MKAFLNLIFCFLLGGTIGFLCLFLCILSSNKKELWNKIISERGKNGRS